LPSPNPLAIRQRSIVLAIAAKDRLWPDSAMPAEHPGRDTSQSTIAALKP
jgi:hypothetical protein